MLELLKKYDDTHLLLIGPVTAQWYLDEILTEAENADTKKRLTIIPGLPPDSTELLQALKTAYCFILPSRHEPFGIAALEALDAQVPLIAAAVGGLKDFLVDGKNALFSLVITPGIDLELGSIAFSAKAAKSGKSCSLAAS